MHEFLNKIENRTETELTVSCVIKHDRAGEILWNKNYLPTNQEINISLSDYLKLSRMFGIEIKRMDRTPYNQNQWKEHKRFGFTGDADTSSGFGNCTVNLIKYSMRAGCDVRWVGKLNNAPEMNKLSNLQIPTDIAMVYHEQPKTEWLDSPFQKNIAIVPFETTQIPYSWVKRINSMDALFVPCAQNVQMMKDSGVKIPIEIIHWGVDEKKFYPLERPVRTNFTFGHMGALSIRKGTDILVEAFQRAFPIRDYPDVELLCKTSNYHYHFGTKDPRIKVHMTAWEHDELLENFFRKIDCFVFPTRGEGFGLTPLEAMATGVPSIVTGWSGPVDYMTPEVGWLIDYEMEPAKDFTEVIYKEYCGDWAKPKIDHLVELLRYAYEHQDEVKEKGANASKHVREYWTWDHKIHMFYEALDKHLS